MYIICDRETGTFVDEFETLAEAEAELTRFEASDKDDGIFEENFYEIVKE